MTLTLLIYYVQAEIQHGEHKGSHPVTLLHAWVFSMLFLRLKSKRKKLKEKSVQLHNGCDSPQMSARIQPLQTLKRRNFTDFDP